MTHRKQEVWLQVTAGRGPSECAWAVVKVLEQIHQDAQSASLEFRTIEIEPGPEPGTAQSALASISGAAALDGFANSWRGTVQWTARSPFRPAHKRKNWFVGIDILEPVDETRFDLERSPLGDDARQRSRRPTRQSNRIRRSRDSSSNRCAGHGNGGAISAPQSQTGASPAHQETG